MLQLSLPPLTSPNLKGLQVPPLTFPHPKGLQVPPLTSPHPKGLQVPSLTTTPPHPHPAQGLQVPTFCFLRPREKLLCPSLWVGAAQAWPCDLWVLMNHRKRTSCHLTGSLKACPSQGSESRSSSAST